MNDRRPYAAKRASQSEVYTRRSRLGVVSTQLVRVQVVNSGKPSLPVCPEGGESEAVRVVQMQKVDIETTSGDDFEQRVW